MDRVKIAVLFAFVCGLGVLVTSGCGGGSSGTQPPPPPPPGKINHVVILFQENRTPDNLFQDPKLYNPPRSADIAQQGQTSTGQTVTLTPTPLVTDYDLSHAHAAFLEAWNNGAMNGADLISCEPSANCPPLPEYQFVQASDVQPYFQMAETYVFGDRMFQTNQGPSFPAHQYILGGTSAVSATSTIFVAENAGHNIRSSDGEAWNGCLSPPTATVFTIDTSNPDPHAQETLTSQLCYEHPTLTDLLNTANISWRYYTPSAGSLWTAPDAIQHICVPFSADGMFDDTVCTGSDWKQHVVIEGTGNQIVQDIAAGQLPSVSWVIPDGSASDHAGNNPDLGPIWITSIVNAIGQSPYWADTAIIITWDDWGGWYDHVPPPQIRNSYEYGLRVPLIVISPFAKPAYTSHVVHDFGSILKFVENTYSLGQIDPSVGYADSRSDDLSDCFDFNQTPLVYQTIAAPMGAEVFLNSKRAPTPPDND